VTIAQWEYEQTVDEASSVSQAVALLHEYLQPQSQPLHLVGHGMSGVVALLYARQHPEQVKSLTLLSVAAQPAITWHAHYYVQRSLLPCSRTQILTQTVRSLFGSARNLQVQSLASMLDRDLESSPLLYTLYGLTPLPKGGVKMPLLVCGAADDSVVDRHAQAEWSQWLKLGDRLWCCPSGKHFFHYFQPEQVGNQLFEFWHSTGAARFTLRSQTV
jgi:pimeloyl-ACP methyl ester carboxylesterase